MAVDRRSALKLLVTAGAATATAGTARIAAAATVHKEAPADALGLLYDSTRCVGCKACVAACARASHLAPDPGGSGGLYQAPIDLNARTKTVVKLAVDGDQRAFVKAQCMHCVDPGCAAACMLGAMHKGEHGIVSYDSSKCIGCRYCQVACPYNVPRFDWASATPTIVKCELCRDQLAKGEVPACAGVCPRGAITFGRRADLLLEAHNRIASAPGHYQNKVYGEHDGGGTQVLYLSRVSFAALGLPTLGTDSIPAGPEAIQHGIYQGFIAPAALYAALGVVVWRNRRKSGDPGKEEER